MPSPAYGSAGVSPHCGLIALQLFSNIPNRVLEDVELAECLARKLPQHMPMAVLQDMENKRQQECQQRLVEVQSRRLQLGSVATHLPSPPAEVVEAIMAEPAIQPAQEALPPWTNSTAQHRGSHLAGGQTRTVTARVVLLPLVRRMMRRELAAGGIQQPKQPAVKPHSPADCIVLLAVIFNVVMMMCHATDLGAFHGQVPAVAYYMPVLEIVLLAGIMLLLLPILRM